MSTPQNPYTHGPLGAVFAKTALPIILVMGMNGLLAVADALFLGHYVGAAALGAVTLMFPLYMFITALATLVASGMSSILARHLGAGHINAAQRVFAGAHGLARLLGEAWIWRVAPFSEALLLLLTLAVLAQTARKHGRRRGLFFAR
ncbi:MATE family efflux transporter [Abyssibius alkaniclasticus]|uniref:MATE family efflux transporter n=1 Tax=Abyssibius alkaniclasticus TaxID=2881234 RepID=UPI00405A0FF7